jgi:very-short-patch-repair endonuclease
MSGVPVYEALPASSFLEWAFLRWVLAAAARPGIAEYVVAQQPVRVDDREYRVDYEVVGARERIAVELDGFQHHGTRQAFTYDRLRQNDLAATGRQVIRFTYDAIRNDTARCVAQLQAMLALDPRLTEFVIPTPSIEPPDMDPDPLHALDAPPRPHHRDQDAPMTTTASYFDDIRTKLNHKTLRLCQQEAFTALANYYGSGAGNAACVMSVGAGKTALACSPRWRSPADAPSSSPQARSSAAPSTEPSTTRPSATSSTACPADPHPWLPTAKHLDPRS